MKKRTIILAGCAFLLALGCLVGPRAFEKRSTPAWPESRGYFSDDSESGLAPVQLWWEAPPGEKESWRAKKATRFTLVRGQAFVGDTLIRKEKIREYLDARVQSHEIDYVVIFPEKDSKWGEIFPVLDECRKSRVRIVLLNEREI
jgi:hypothetical protein